MPIHKFIRKRGRVPSRPPVAVVWHPYENLEHPPTQLEEFKWQVYAQKNLNIAPHDNKTLTLQFGVEISMGIILISLDDQLKAIRCSIMNESVGISTNNIVTSLLNNSDKDITINKGDKLCYLTFTNINYINYIYIWNCEILPLRG
jgi:dUTPase